MTERSHPPSVAAGLQPARLLSVAAGLQLAVRRAAPLAILALLALANPGFAHDQTISYSRWRIDGRSAEVSVRLSRLDLSRFPWGSVPGGPPERLVARYLSERLTLLAGDEPCTIAEPPHSIPASPENVAYAWRLHCPDEGELRLRSDLLFEVAPSHLHIARVETKGAGNLERVLTEGERVWALGLSGSGSNRPAAATLGDYLLLGIEHILTGYDHLAFVAALLLVGGSLGETAKIVTGFTLAHSITLALAVLGHLQPDRAPIEALIGLSIAIVAAENLWLSGGKRTTVHLLIAAVLASVAAAAFAGEGRIPALTLLGVALFTPCYLELVRRTSNAVPLRAAIAFLFGLVHGFGFAGVLMEAELPAARLGHALFGFNAGVEMGQLAVVALLWPVLRLAATRRASIHATIVDVASGAVLALGVFWFVSRAFL
jgi:HupE / UreJ protein